MALGRHGYQLGAAMGAMPTVALRAIVGLTVGRAGPGGTERLALVVHLAHGWNQLVTQLEGFHGGHPPHGFHPTAARAEA